MAKSCSYRCIPLTQEQYAFVDADDFEWLNQWPWFARWNPEAKTFYASRCVIGADGKQQTLHMHNVVVPPAPGLVIDHWNGCGLDNRRINLRCVTPSVNAINRRMTSLNTSGYTGVYYIKRDERWVATVEVRGKKVCLGYFERKKDAIAARRAGESRYYKSSVRSGAPEIPPVIVDPNISRAKSVRNTSGFEGVSRKRQGWRARVRIDGIEKCIGHFDSPEEASHAREQFLLNYRNP
jgi:hypothetical protein